MDILQKPDAFCFSSALKDIIIQAEIVSLSLLLRNSIAIAFPDYTGISCF
jgi:hypothetical protein